MLTMYYKNNIILLESDTMETSILNVRVDTNDKKNFEQFCNNVGMNVSTAVNMFIKAVLRENKLPFEIKTAISDKEICEKLKEADEEIKNNSKRYTSDEILDSIKDIIG